MLLYKYNNTYLFLTDHACTHEFNGESGLFATKNYPEEYKDRSECNWNITVAETFKVKLTFHLFDVSA